jgi:hypothetical protein
LADITQSRYQALLKRLFAIKASDPGRVLDPVVKPTYDVADIYRPEERLMRGERRWGSPQVASNLVGGFTEVLAGFPIPGGVSNKIAVIKRVTWAATLPTSTTQPGNCYVAVTIPFLGPPAITLQANLNDARVSPSAAGGLSAIRFGAQGSQPVASYGTFAAACVYQESVSMGAATTPNFRIQVNDLDVVLTPGYYVGIDFKSDTLPTGTWTWTVLIEGFERTIDPSELIPPP